jgi:hypothetical protein
MKTSVDAPFMFGVATLTDNAEVAISVATEMLPHVAAAFADFPDVSARLIGM